MMSDTPDNNDGIPQWTEFSDRNIVDWKRVRSAIEHENILVNHRLTWLFTSQGFLFAAFTLAFVNWKKDIAPNSVTASSSEYPYVMLVIQFVGLSTALLIWRAVRGAERQLARLDNWWHSPTRDQIESLERPCKQTTDERIAAMRRLLFTHPPIQGAGDGLDYIFRTSSIPLFFVLSWILLSIIGFDALGSAKMTLQGSLQQYWPIFVTAIATLLAKAAFDKFLVKRKSPSR